MRNAERQLRQFIRESLLLEETVPNPAAEIQRRIQIFNTNIDKLEKDYPEAFYDLTARHPEFLRRIEELRNFSRTIDMKPSQQTALNELIRLYNDHSTVINEAIKLDVDPKLVHEAEIAAQELYKAMFPETYVSRFVKYLWDVEELDEFYKWLIAPLEGVENALSAWLKFRFDPETRAAAGEGIMTWWNMSDEERALALKALKVAWENIPTIDRARAIFSWLSTCLIIFGGVARLVQLTGAPRWIVGGLTAVQRLTSYTPLLKALPAAVVAGILLEPIEVV